MALERGILGYGRVPMLLGYGRIPGPLGLRGSPDATGLLTNPRSPLKIFEPQPNQGWNPDLTLEDYTGAPLHFIPPTFAEVRQGQTGNCPVVATMAAMAHASVLTIINRISTRYVNVAAETIDTNHVSPTWRTVETETGLYKIRFAKGDPVEVTGLLWTRRDQPEYASSTNNGALWPSLVEKGYVVAHAGNSYQTISGSVTPYEAMTNMLGPATELVLKDDPKNLVEVLKAAPNRPTIAGTLTTFPPELNALGRIIVSSYHTYAVLNVVAKSKKWYVKLFDVRDGQTIELELANFKKVFESVVQLEQ